MNLLTVKNLYVRIEGKVIVENLNYRLKELEARLDPALFVRLARGTLANIEMIARVSPMPGGTFVVTLKNNQQLQASRLQSRILREGLLRI
jgi:two-component system LytT family response regulator